MPQATTTSVALGPVADLPGPGAQTASPKTVRPSFDTLLRPSARKAAALAPNKSSSDLADTAENHAQPALTEEQPSPFEVVCEENDPSLTEPEQSSAADTLLVESLAGLAVAMPPIVAVDTPMASEESTDSENQTPSDVGELPPRKSGAQVPGSVREQLPNKAGELATSTSELRAAKTPEVRATIDTRASAPAALAEARVDSSPNAKQQIPVAATSVAASSAVNAAATAKTVGLVEAKSDETPVRSLETSAIGLNRLETPSPDASNAFTTDSRDQTSDDQSPSEDPDQSDPPPVELAALTENLAAHPPIAPEIKTETPAAAPTASSLAHTDPHQSVSVSRAATALASLPSPQIVLPADVLAQPAVAPSRRAAPPIDTRSLLTRVTRAFAAAQERDGEIRLRLSPPELGSLRLEIRIQDNVMVAHLQTETEAARTAIVENLPALRERLSDQGVRIERFDVDLMHRQPGGTPDQPGQHPPEAPLAPLRVAPPPRPRSQAAAAARPSPAAASTSGLNVIV